MSKKQISAALDPRLAGFFATRPPHERILAMMLAAVIGPEGQAAVLDTLDGSTNIDWSQRVAGTNHRLHYFNGKTAADVRREGFPDHVLDTVREMYASRGLAFPDDDPATRPTPPAAAHPAAGTMTEEQAATLGVVDGVNADTVAAGNPGGPLPGGVAPNKPAEPPGTAPTDANAADGSTDTGPGNPGTSTPGGGASGAGDSGKRVGEGDKTGGNGEEPTYGGRPLSAYEGKTDEEILAMDNVGQATLKKIRGALASVKGAPSGGPGPNGAE